MLAAAQAVFKNRRKAEGKVPQRHPAARLQFGVGSEPKAACKVRKASVLGAESELLRQHRGAALLGRRQLRHPLLQQGLRSSGDCRHRPLQLPVEMGALLQRVRVRRLYEYG